MKSAVTKPEAQPGDALPVNFRVKILKIAINNTNRKLDEAISIREITDELKTERLFKPWYTSVGRFILV